MCLPPRGFLRKISKCTPITKFTPIFVLYRKVTEALWKCFGFDFHLFLSSLSPKLWKHYGSHGSPENHFSTTWRSLPPSCFLLKQPNFQNIPEGPRFEFLFTPYLDKFTPYFYVFGCFLSKISQNFTDSTAMSVKPSEVINNGPQMTLECNSLLTHTPLC